MFAKLLLKLSGVLIFIFAFFPAEVTLGQKAKKQKLKIELGQHFRNDEVKIYLDKKLVYHNKLSTPDSVAITDVFEVTKPKDAFTVTVEINGNKFEKSAPKQQKELNDEAYSLIINYNREAEEVEVKTKTVIILYD